MALCVSYSNILSSIGGFIGALSGGLLSSLTFSILGLSSIMIIFLLSSLTRIIVTIIIANKIKEVREVKEFKIHHVKEKIKTMKPKFILYYLGLMPVGRG